MAGREVDSNKVTRLVWVAPFYQRTFNGQCSYTALLSGGIGWRSDASNECIKAWAYPFYDRNYVAGTLESPLFCYDDESVTLPLLMSRFYTAKRGTLFLGLAGYDIAFSHPNNISPTLRIKHYVFPFYSVNHMLDETAASSVLARADPKEFRDLRTWGTTNRTAGIKLSNSDVYLVAGHSATLTVHAPLSPVKPSTDKKQAEKEEKSTTEEKKQTEEKKTEADGAKAAEVKETHETEKSEAAEEKKLPTAEIKKPIAVKKAPVDIFCPTGNIEAILITETAGLPFLDYKTRRVVRFDGDRLVRNEFTRSLSSILFSFDNTAFFLDGTSSRNDNVGYFLYNYERTSESAALTLFPGIRRATRTDGYVSTSFLWRFFRWESDPASGRRALDLLFLPVYRTTTP